MREKVLKIEISLLFLFALLSSLYFYFQENLPDHFLTISSDNTSINFFSYGLTSLIVGVEYFSGTWLIFPSLFFFMAHGLFFARRQYTLDLFLLFPILTFFLMLCYLFFPIMLGQGMAYLLHENVEWHYSWAILIGSLFAIFAGCFRTSFRKQVAQASSPLIGPLSSLLAKTKYIAGLCPRKVTAWHSQRSLENAPKYLNEFSKSATGSNAPQGQETKTDTPPEEQSKNLAHLKNSKKPSSLQSTTPEGLSQKGQEEGSSKAIKAPPPTLKELVACLRVEDQDTDNDDPKDCYFKDIIEKIEDKLAEFNVDAKILDILKGPVVDTFELELGEGVRVARVTSLAQDLGLALSGSPLRIIYPMEGKTTVGVEVPRKPRKVVFLHEVLNSKDFQKGLQNIPLAMGKNAFGHSYVVDLTKMPHMLVAGTTGAGKSVFVNTLLISMLIKMPPEKLKLILIDPKQLELALYRNLPHLAMPVITDHAQATVSLMWAVEEMERRYTILSKLEVRSIDSFNMKIKTASPETLSSISHLYHDMQTAGYELPYLVIIIDEFADLVLVKNGKAIEGNICRLAAKARACGIHLIIATQRPSVDVITGLIKANFPTRVSFRVTAGQDSRTILNAIGAENLLGKGDMLYKHGIEMRRLHAAYVSDEQISQLVDRISSASNGPNFWPIAVDYLETEAQGRAELPRPMTAPGGMGRAETGGQNNGKAGEDPLYREAVKIVLEHQSASASMIQRRLKVGYNRAANLIEAMESTGVIGPQQGPRPREVLMDTSQDSPETESETR